MYRLNIRLLSHHCAVSNVTLKHISKTYLDKALNNLPWLEDLL